MSVCQDFALLTMWTG